MIRWDEPIEAVHRDTGAIAKNVAILDKQIGNRRTVAIGALKQSVTDDGWSGSWSIRNVAKAPETPIDEGKSVNELSGCYKGVIHEMTATIWLMTQGYQVFKNVCPSGPIDLIAIRDTEIIRIDVKTATLKRQADGVMRYNAAFLTQEQESIGVKMLLAHNGVILGWRDDVIDPSRSRRALEKEAGR